MKNKPRRGCPGDGIPRTTLDPAQAALHQWTTDSADVLDLPAIASERETGRVLEVAPVGIDGAGLLTGAEPADVRCTTGRASCGCAASPRQGGGVRHRDRAEHPGRRIAIGDAEEEEE